MRQKAARLIAFIFCFLLQVTSFADSIIMLPDSITHIEAEAFMGDTAITKVEIPGGTRSIGERAFANTSLTMITLPESLEQIADNAFEGCNNFVAVVKRNGYARQFCIDHQIEYRYDDDLYMITGLTYEKSHFRVTVSAEADCIIRIDVLSEYSDLLDSVYGKANALSSYSEVIIPIEDSSVIPAFFILRAVLLDENAETISNSFTTMQYTKAHMEFEALGPSDYPEMSVIDFGESGYGVVKEGTISIPGTASTIDQKAYVIPANIEVKQGVTILVTLQDGNKEVLKVKRITDNCDGTISVERDPDVSISELFDVVKISSTVDIGTAAQNDGNAQINAASVASSSVSLEGSYSTGPFSVSASGSGKISFDLSYNAKLLGKDYIEAQMLLTKTIEFNATLTGAIESSDLKDAFGMPLIPEFTIYEGPISLIGAGTKLVSLQLKISVPLTFSIEADGEFSALISDTSGFNYSSISGMTKIEESSKDYDFEINGSFSLQIGPRVSLKVSALMGLFEGELYGQSGIRVTGTANLFSAEAGESTVHACNICCDISPVFYFDIGGKIEANVTENFNPSLDVKLLSINKPLGKAYFSIINEKDSMFHGKVAFGEGECPNKKHRVNIKTQYTDGSALDGILFVICKNGDEIFSGISPDNTYLYNGDFLAKAFFETGEGCTSFVILDTEAEIVVQEPSATITGVVASSATNLPIGGAEVSAVTSTGEIITALTDFSGKYQLNIPNCSLVTLNITAEEYANWTTTVNPSSNDIITVDALLKPLRCTVSFDANGGIGSMSEIEAASGTTVTLPQCDFYHPAGNVFACWMIDGKNYFAGDIYVMPDKNVSARAVWINYYSFSGHYYTYFDNCSSWEEAENYCKSLGGHLATLTSAAEDHAVYGYLESVGISWGYFGFSDDAVEGEWRWVTGEDSSYTNWHQGEPNNENQHENYAMFYGKFTDGTWNDADFGSGAIFICEWDSISALLKSFQ